MQETRRLEQANDTGEAWIDQAQRWFADHPENFGLLLAFVGLVLLIGTLFRWGWVLEIRVGWIGESLYRRYGDKFVVAYMYTLSFFILALGLAWYFGYTLWLAG